MVLLLESVEVLVRHPRLLYVFIIFTANRRKRSVLYYFQDFITPKCTLIFHDRRGTHLNNLFFLKYVTTRK